MSFIIYDDINANTANKLIDIIILNYVLKIKIIQ